MKKVIYFFAFLFASPSLFSQDIIVSHVQFDSIQYQYQQFECNIVLKNIGNDTISQFNVTQIYFSKDSLLDGNDKRAGFVNFINLNPGDSLSEHVIGGFNQFGINADSNYNYVIVQADFRGEVTEENEDNNIWVGNIKVRNVNVDLKLDTAIVSPSDTVYEGQIFNVSLTLKNEGNRNINNSSYRYFLSRDSIIDTADFPIGISYNQIYFNWNLTALASNTLPVPRVDPANYFLILEIDTLGQELVIHDSDYTNNKVVLAKIFVKNEPIDSTLSFNRPFGTREWTEDGYNWRWDRTGVDRISTQDPFRGAGHASAEVQSTSKLVFPKPAEIKGFWLHITNSFNLENLVVIGYNAFEEVAYEDTLDIKNYEFDYAYKTVNWQEVKYFKFEGLVDTIFGSIIYYDELDYIIMDDTIAPVIECIDDQVICTTNVLPDYTDSIIVSDNNSTIRIEQVPAPGTLISGTIPVKIIAEDGLNNIDSCSFNVTLFESKIVDTACNSYTSPSGNIWTSSGIYFDTLSNSLGCDSIVQVDLIINNSSNSTLVDTACNSYISPSGNIWTSSGIYFDTLSNSLGCDSVITIDLLIDCTSSTYERYGLPLKFYPNPVHDFIVIKLNEFSSRLTLELYDMNGKLVSKEVRKNAKQLNFKVDVSSGMYLLKIINDEGRSNTIELIKL